MGTNEPPECPLGHGPMMHFLITDGEDRPLGCFWGCSRDDRDKPDYCDECEECGCTSLAPLITQLDLFNEATA